MTPERRIFLIVITLRRVTSQTIPCAGPKNIFLDVYEDDVLSSFGQGEGVTVWLFCFIRYLR